MFMLFVGLIALAYEHSRSYALERQRIALQEKEQANIRLQQSGDAKSRFLANMSHGVLSLLLPVLFALYSSKSASLISFHLLEQSFVLPCTESLQCPRSC